MALVHYGPIASDVRGSMGGTVFSRNRSGGYMRARVVPVNPQTTRQANVRSYLANLQAAFRDTLTPAERAGWQATANLTTRTNKLGLGITLTAQNLYIMINSIVLGAGETRIDTPPVPPAGIDGDVATISGNTTDGVRVTAALPVPGVGDILQFQVSPAVNQTVNFYKGPFVSTVYRVGTITFPFTLVSDSACAVGQRYHIRYRTLTADGHISVPTPAIIDITV